MAIQSMSTLSARIWTIIGGMKMISEELEHARTSFWDKHLQRMPLPLTSGSWATALFYNVKEDTNKPFLDQFLINYMVEFDPDDTLILCADDGNSKTFQMHSLAWLQSVDYLLWRQLTLALREDNGNTIMLRVPTWVQERYQNDKHNSVAERKILSVPIPSYFPKPRIFKKLPKADGYVVYQAPPFLEPSHLNFFCHELFPRDNKTTWLSDPRRDATLFSLDDMGDLPIFQLEDYVAHELKTGISLSTEIAAVVLELDEAIREIALNKFFETALEDIVQFPFPFARISTARNFFQQISSEWSREKYLWNNQSAKGREAEILADAFRRARKHVNSLYNAPIYMSEKGDFQISPNPDELEAILRMEKAQTEDPMLPRKYRITRDPTSGNINSVRQYMVPFLPEFPDTKDPSQMDMYMEHIDAYLQSVRSPLDWSTIKGNPAEHLAVFTNPSHKHIPLLLNHIKTGNNRKHYKGDSFPCAGSEAKKLYVRIHERVRSVSQSAYADLNWIKKYLYTY